MDPTSPAAAATSIVVNTRLPEGGLDAVLDLDMTPISNARGYRALMGIPDPGGAGHFPMEALEMAASSPEFLRALGKPLGIAKDLESEPGVWMLSTADDRHQWVIFSDCHRKNAWKGGQICAVYGGAVENFTMEHPTIDLLRQAVAEQWGMPEGLHDAFRWEEFFQAAEAERPGRTWPREEKAPVIKPKRVRGPRR